MQRRFFASISRVYTAVMIPTPHPNLRWRNCPKLNSQQWNLSKCICSEPEYRAKYFDISHRFYASKFIACLQYSLVLEECTFCRTCLNFCLQHKSLEKARGTQLSFIALKTLFDIPTINKPFPVFKNSGPLLTGSLPLKRFFRKPGSSRVCQRLSSFGSSQTRGKGLSSV